MKKRLSSPLQILIFAALFGAATALWVSREQVTAYYVTITGKQGKDEIRRRPSDRAAPVVVEPVRRMVDDATIQAIATARAKQSVTLFPKVSGEIVELTVSAGDRVSRGDVIARLNSEQAKLAVDLARSKLEDARRQFERAESLRENNVNSQARVEDAANLLAQAELELQQAEASLNERTLAAPFGGVVGIPNVELGDRVAPETSIVSLDDRSVLFVEIEVPEQYMARVNLGHRISASSASFSNRTFEGAVTEIDSRIDPVTRAMLVRASLDNREDLLRPGMSFAVKLTLPGESYPGVPELAVQWRSGESYVWVVRNGEAGRVTVRAVRRLRSYILIDGPLNAGELVVVEGVQRLRQGTPVTFTEPPAPRSGES